MHNIKFMRILNSVDELMIQLARFCLLELPIIHDILKELAVLNKLHHEKQILCSLNDLVKLNDIGMTDELQDVNLARYSLNIGNVNDFVLFEDFDCNGLPCWLMGGVFYLSEGTLAQGLPDLVVAYQLLWLVCQFRWLCHFRKYY